MVEPIISTVKVDIGTGIYIHKTYNILERFL